jgi:hypothetical protein
MSIFEFKTTHYWLVMFGAPNYAPPPEREDWLAAALEQKPTDWIVVKAGSEREALMRWQEKMRARGLDPTGDWEDPMAGADKAHLVRTPLDMGSDRPSEADFLEKGNAALRGFWTDDRGAR